LATHVIDLMPYATRRRREALDPEHEERFSADTWFELDACCPPWPFPDRFFDFAVCSNLLEDVRDPLVVCGELNRVAKAGYIETPSRLREIFVKQRWSGAWLLLAHLPEIGFYHHRWFVELSGRGTHLRFTAKTSALGERRRNYLTRGDIGRKLSEMESGIGLFWERGFSFEEVFVDARQDYPAFRVAALAALKSRRPLPR
jgi:hypothetical protein